MKKIWSFRETGVLLALLLIWLAGAVLRPDFFPTRVNFFNLFREMSQLGVVALGMTFVLNNGDIDLSVGSVLGLATTIFAILTKFYDVDAWIVVPIVLLSGAGVGFINGVLSTKLQVPAFIATLGMLFLARGLVLLLSGGYLIAPLPPSSFYVISQNNAYLGGLNNQTVILIVVGVVASLVLSKTVFGMQILSTGGNRQAAILAGIHTDRVRIASFVICSTLAALGGLMNIAFLRNFAPTTGQAYELDVIAAVVVGGASIFGGRGSGLGTILGAGLLVSIRKIFTIGIWLGGERPWRLLQTAHPIFIGTLIVLAVLIDIWVREEGLLPRLWARLRGRPQPPRYESMAASEALSAAGAPAPLPAGNEARSWLGRLLASREAGGAVLLAGLLVIGASLRPDYFFLWDNMVNVLRDQIVEFGLIAVGMTLVILNGDIDLSVGAMASLAASFWSVMVQVHGLDPWLAASLTVMVGVAVGLVNGFLSTKARIPAFLATLGMLQLARGASATLSGGWGLSQFPPSLFNELGRDNPLLGGLPNQVVLMVVVFVVGAVLLWRTAIGYQIYAIGGNRRAALLSGIAVDRVRIGTFVICSTLAALAGMVSVTKLGSFAPQLGLGWELTVIAGVIIGGTSIFGGKGSIVGTMIGIFILGYLNSILISGILIDDRIRAVPQRWLQVIIGVVILVAVLFDIWVRDQRIVQQYWAKLTRRARAARLATGLETP